jgi:hypothetical protein
MADNDLSAAIAEAVAEKGGAVIGSDATAPEVPAPGEGETHDAPVVDQTGEAETPDGEQPTVPEEFYGTRLDGVPPEARAEIIARFEQEESTIRKLQQELAAAKEKTPEPVVEEDFSVDNISDEDLLKAAGYDPEDMDVQMNAKFLVPSLRRELALEDQISRLTTKAQVAEAETAWNRRLDELETVHGKLPFDRLEALQYAVEHKLASPGDLYLALSVPRREVEQAVAEARRKAAQAAASGVTRPASSSAGEAPVTKDMTLREAVAAAAKSAQKETGRSWSNIFRREGVDAD